MPVEHYTEDRFVPVTISEASAVAKPAMARGNGPATMTLAWSTGETLQFDAGIDPALHDRVLGVLLR
jgi:hypothetical protein